VKFDIKRLRKIIQEEHKKLISEQVDHEAIRDVVTSASKLLAAVESFKATAPPHVINALVPHADSLEKMLEDMLGNPGSYVQKAKPEPRKVSLRAVKD